LPDSEDKENVMPRKTVELKSLQEELALERRLRMKAQDQVDFMKMECQFECCSCRIAERTGNRYVHDDNFASEIQKIKMSVPQQDVTEDQDTTQEDDKDDESDHDRTEIVRRVNLSLVSETSDSRSSKVEAMELDATEEPKAPVPAIEDEVEMEAANEVVEPSVVILSDNELVEQSQTLLESTSLALETKEEEIAEQEQESEQEESEDMQALHQPRTPVHREVRTITTTTTIPIMFSPLPPSSEQPMTPMTIGHAPLAQLTGSPFPSNALKADGTLDREAALELIRQRRGRARSVAMGYATPKRQMIEGNSRRDVSAPTLRAWTKQ
jgi:hypothetical protein